jgi:hypothetical protein
MRTLRRLDPETLVAAIRRVLQVSGDLSSEVFVDGQAPGGSGKLRRAALTGLRRWGGGA